MESKKINQLATNVAPVSTDLTIIGDPITGVSKKITLLQLASIFSGSIAFYTNYAAFPATGTVNTIYCAKDTNKLYLWSGSAYVETFPSQALLDTYQLRSEKGVSNGYASLDSGGKVPISQLPSSIMEYKGMWSATTNTPTLANGTGDTGDVYICNGAGSVNFGAGAITFAIGDYVVYSGTIWQRSSGAVGTVTSVGLSSATSGVTIGSSPITTSGTITLAIADATTSQNGLLTSTDWATFNGKFNLPSLTSGSVLFSNGTTIAQNNANFFWDNTNSRLGINTTTPGQALDVHSTTNTLVQLNNTTTADSVIAFQNQNVTKWKIGNVYNAGANSFDIYNPVTSTTPLSISSTGQITLTANVNTTGAQFVGNGLYITYVNAGALAGNTNIWGRTNGLNFALGNLTGGAGFIFQTSTSYDYTFPAATGTIALTSQLTSGTVTSVAALTLGTTGTDLSSTVANGTTTPVITLNVPTASATNRGALSSTDWSTFNNKQAALTNPVTGTGTTNYLSKFTGTSTIGNSLIWDNGTNVGIGNTNTSYTLDVSGTGRFTGILTANGGTNSTNGIQVISTLSGSLYTGGIEFFRSTTLGGSKIEPVRDAALGGVGLSFLTTANNAAEVSGTYSTRMTITSAGNVGIGTSSPIFNSRFQVKMPSTTFWNGITAISSTDESGIYMGHNGTVGAIGTTYGSSGSFTPLIFQTSEAERMRIFSNGNVAIGRDSDTGYKFQIKAAASTDTEALLVCQNGANSISHYFFSGVNSAMSTADANIWVRRNGTTSRSINAAGTINASGADYAEYMLKAIYDNIEKGDIVGVDINAQLTNIFADSVSFVVKSTDPAYVGGDTWFNVEPPIQSDYATKEEYDIAYAEFVQQREEARQKVDRVAFSGQVPCNVLGANVGDYIIPIDDNGKIKGQAITNPTFEEYQISIGKVWKIMEDGRAWIAVKIG